MIVFFIDFVVGECFFYDFLREVFVNYRVSEEDYCWKFIERVDEKLIFKD